jgi:hypothetical protein
VRQHHTPAVIEESIDSLEALANGELDFDTHDTEMFFASPRVGVKIHTPNGSTIRVSRVLRPQFTECDMWIMAEGEVLSAPQCPKYKGSNVTFLVSQDGTICFFEEH